MQITVEPTLDDCNDVLDWIDEEFELGKNFNCRIREIEGMYFIALTCYTHERPAAAKLYPPVGWAMDRWTRDQDGFWKSTFYRTHE